jgi:hypothetical protein
MKIKLQDYSLISNELVQQIDFLLASNEDSAHGGESLEIGFVRKKLEQLISSEKLAEKCFDVGREDGFYSQVGIYQEHTDKETFLTSEIEIE